MLPTTLPAAGASVLSSIRPGTEVRVSTSVAPFALETGPCIIGACA